MLLIDSERKPHTITLTKAEGQTAGSSKAHDKNGITLLILDWSSGTSPAEAWRGAEDRRESYNALYLSFHQLAIHLLSFEC